MEKIIPPSLPSPSRGPWRARLASALVLAAAGCAHYQPKPLVLDQTAAAYDARSLDGADLRRFLEKNLGRDFAAWPPAEWDFETLAWVAFHNNPSLDVARAQWETARAGVKTGTAPPNPTLAFTPGYNSSSSGISPWFPALTLDFLLENRGKRELRAESARRAAESARQAVFTAAWQVRSELRKALLDLASAAQRGAGLREQAQIQQRLAALLDLRLRAGTIAGREISTARLAVVRAEAAASEAERTAALARQRVAQALSLPAAALAHVRFAPPPPPAILTAVQLSAARRRSLLTRADVLGALARFAAAQSALDLEIAKQRPDLHLGPGYQWDQGDSKWSLALTFELPLFNHNEGPIAEAEARRREAAAQFLATQARALAEIDSAAAAQSAAVAQIESLHRVQAAFADQQSALAARLRAGGADQLEVQGAALERAAVDQTLRDAEALAALAAGQLEDALQIPFSNLATLATPGPTSALPSSP